MAKRSNLGWVSGILLAAALLLSIFGFSIAEAASVDFNVVNTAPATTTLSYMTPGTATTTLTYDTLFNGSDSAVLLTQFTASSTSSVLNMNVQYSQDGIDWYADDLIDSINSTTTPNKSIQVVNTYSWIALGTTVANRAITIPTPTRYTRVQYSITGAAGAIWGSMVAKKQQPE